MKKQIALAILAMTFASTDIYSAARAALRREQAAVKGTDNSNTTKNTTNNTINGPALPTKAQADASIAANPVAAAAACQKALNELGLSTSGTPDSTTYNYIMG